MSGEMRVKGVKGEGRGRGKGRKEERRIGGRKRREKGEERIWMRGRGEGDAR